MREGVSFIIHESRALGETSRAIIRKCCMLKSQNNRGVLELVAAVKTKGKENRIIKGRLGLVGCCVSWAQTKEKK